jgi:hypothetical protein
MAEKRLGQQKYSIVVMFLRFSGAAFNDHHRSAKAVIAVNFPRELRSVYRNGIYSDDRSPFVSQQVS